ncbi:hypothetical protein BT96DRAFT_977877 [Gymnopus androsaceus JB14]|uniref:Uncharacterized protein n=1 Tax=Gymnopus androsaceus JB14 TaxID=1447944 RepID=A0A6A4HDG8_9AGAR|nr:hypothetical protein BT96DRAFT_977877 [Gymnopus androsaceus JB14]
MGLKSSDWKGSICDVLDLPQDIAPRALQLSVEKLCCADIVSIIRSGDSPSPSELPALDLLADDTQETIDCFQLELDRLQRLTAILEISKSRLNLYKRGILSMRAPIRRLPLDVLGEIFERVSCNNQCDNTIGARRAHSLGTLALSQVCSRWYKIVASMPALWSSFEFHSTHLQKPHPLIPLFLERSRLHNLSFSMNIWYQCGEGNNFCDATGFFSTQNTNRWRSVVVKGRLDESQIVLQSLLAEGRVFPELSNLSITSSLGIADFERSLDPITIACPKLRSLKLLGLNIDLKFTQPCNTVECADLQGLTFWHASRILADFPSVQDVTLNIIWDEDVLQWQPLTLHCARTIKIIMQAPASRALGFMSSMLDKITSLGLARLTLIFVWGTEAPSFLKSLSSMLRRSQASLTHLTLHRIPFTSHEVLQLLCLVPNLISFHYKENTHWNGMFVDRLLKILTPPHLRHALEGEGDTKGDEDWDTDNNDSTNLEQDGLLLPNLQELNLVTATCKVPLLVNFIRLRRTCSSSCLQKLTVGLYGGDTWMIETEKFNEFKDDGMDIFIDILYSAYDFD